MKRSEAYHILNELYQYATETQQEALNIAQDDIQIVDLMFNIDDIVNVVRCKDCRFLINRPDGTYGCYRHFVDECKLDDYCSYGERRHENC